ncbi:MAG: glycerophosphodiester phosphodiesterase family protein [Gemmatimonadaceae bacterium]
MIASVACGKTEVVAPRPRGSAFIIAHRGASALAPEHTIAAYDKAVELGADYLELDVQRSKDGVLVVIHDAGLDRTARGPSSNCTGPVANKTLAQLESCDVGVWFALADLFVPPAEFIGLRIPTLDEVLTRYRTTARFYIETKNPEMYPGIEADIVALLKKHGIAAGNAAMPGVFIESFSSASLLSVHALDSSIPLVQLFNAESPASISGELDRIRSYATAIGVNKEDVTPALIDASHKRCLQVHPYVVDDSDEMLSLLASGVDGIFTNRPDRLAIAIAQVNHSEVGDSGCTALAR